MVGEINGVAKFYSTKYLILVLKILGAYTCQSAFLNIMFLNRCPFIGL